MRNFVLDAFARLNLWAKGFCDTRKKPSSRQIAVFHTI